MSILKSKTARWIGAISTAIGLFKPAVKVVEWVLDVIGEGQTFAELWPSIKSWVLMAYNAPPIWANAILVLIGGALLLLSRGTSKRAQPQPVAPAANPALSSPTVTLQRTEIGTPDGFASHRDRIKDAYQRLDTACDKAARLWSRFDRARTGGAMDMKMEELASAIGRQPPSPEELRAIKQDVLTEAEELRRLLDVTF